MREISTSVTFEIKPGETVPMRIARGTRLAVQGNAVWATRSNDIDDYWLEPGDSLKLRERERLWLSVEGEQPAYVVFTIVPRCDERAIQWLSAGIERLAQRFRSGWRTV
ncbi:MULTISPECIES: DUF2917 domain-containing protein [unclassified Caballeronia]|uniref:DUF2917 domain-containing protein n=1 Tax=unclassified Caballeronia TaxID=2646786 RepID=UPI00286532FA|nr:MULTISPECIES: DUF2917 domain-containing protein [unclassified Caballeronia]MDR5812209.1 DUF2917 domain-containing protein [Caballeronia sp. LZ033]MDR5819035.1 DUF2917 domain-containing protein [Caballeronia sp. LZ043]MDR5876832.1 DUF2917 domain-containing protein [Caballeronia sp. LZ032]